MSENATQAKAKHSPGPWTRGDLVLGNGDSWEHRGIDVPLGDGRGKHIRCIQVYNEDEERREANASLIIAAPDLLAVCRKFVETFAEARKTGRSEIFTGVTIDELRAAVAKAEAVPESD